jgi:hypothetical protein
MSLSEIQLIQYRSHQTRLPHVSAAEQTHLPVNASGITTGQVGVSEVEVYQSSMVKVGAPKVDSSQGKAIVAVISGITT